MNTNSNDLSMTEKLIQFFVLKTKGHITKTQLVKFLYLADLYATKWHGQQITDLQWIFYNHGPWQEDIEKALYALDLQGMVSQEKSDRVVLVKPGQNSRSIEQLELPKSMQLMLENIRRAWAGTTRAKIDDLLEYVYATAPMKEVLAKEYTPEQKQRLNLLKERELLIEELGNLVYT
jgi:hypothetical protein